MHNTLETYLIVRDAMEKLGYEPSNGKSGYAGFHMANYPSRKVTFWDAIDSIANIGSPIHRKMSSILTYNARLEETMEYLYTRYGRKKVADVARLQFTNRYHSKRMMWINNYLGKWNPISFTSIDQYFEEYHEKA